MRMIELTQFESYAFDYPKDLTLHINMDYIVAVFSITLRGRSGGTAECTRICAGDKTFNVTETIGEVLMLREMQKNE